MTNAAMGHTSLETGSRSGQCQIEASLRVHKQNLDITEATQALPAVRVAFKTQTFICVWTFASYAGRS